MDSMLQSNEDPSVCCPQETHLSCKDAHRLKVEVQEKMFHTNGNQKKAEAAVLNSRQNRLENEDCDRRP